MRTDDTALVPLAPGKTPRRWQEEAMLAIRKHLPGHRSILVSAATGTGKGTLIASLIVKAARAGRRCLFLVHRDELIDDVMERAREIEPALYAGKVKGTLNEVDRVAVFASVQTLKGKRLASLTPFDFVITDEGHHAAARSYRAVYARVFELNPKARHIGFTATPFRNNTGGKTMGLGGVFEALVYEYSLSDAITEGALCPVRGLRVETQLDLTGVDPDDEEKILKLVDTDERNAIVAEKYLEHCAGQPAIVFAAGIEHAKRIAAEMRKRGVSADAVWGQDKERARKIAAYKAGALTVLVNQNLLTEGFDAPATRAVLLDRPTQSRGLYAQMVGRATRLYPGKEEGLILDFVGNSETHSLASFADLTNPAGRPRIEIGAVVRHRRLAHLEEGMVSALTPAEDPKEFDAYTATVDWRGHDADDHKCSELVLLRPPRHSQDVIVPTVLGVNEFSISLFGGRKIGWYTYESSKGKILVTRGKRPETSALLRKHGDQWEAWQRTGQDVECVAVGDFGDVEAAVTIDPAPFNRDWQRDPATDGQLNALRKFGLGKKTNISKGEASLLLELKIVGLLINRHAEAMAAK